LSAAQPKMSVSFTPAEKQEKWLNGQAAVKETVKRLDNGR